MMIEIEKTEKRILDEILKQGFVKKDIHLNRTVKEMPGSRLTIPQNMIEDLSKIPLADKYKNDNERIFKYYHLAVEKAKEDKDSRQLVLLNTQDYEKELQCFQLMQFVYIEKLKGFLCIVYQRSCDITKLIQDWTFFSHLVKSFEKDTGIKTSMIAVNYGSLHAQI